MGDEITWGDLQQLTQDRRAAREVYVHCRAREIKALALYYKAEARDWEMEARDAQLELWLSLKRWLKAQVALTQITIKRLRLWLNS